MAYVRIPQDDLALGSSGCGPSCSCGACRRSVEGLSSFSERYEREEEESPLPPATPPRVRPPAANFSGWGRFGELLPRRNVPAGNGLQLRMPAFETITGFPTGRASLSSAQVQAVERSAEFIARSWSGAAPVTSIRITGYIDARESQPDLGRQRALAVRDALLHALGSTGPGLATRLRWIIEDRGLADVAKVEIYLWVGPTAMAVPPLVRIPSPAETSRRIIPAEAETPEQRIERILRTVPPGPPPRRTFNELFWRRVDEQLNSAMQRLGVRPSLRGPIRNGARAAIRRGSEELLKQILSASELPGGAQEAIQGTIKAFLQVPAK
jgi:hypothetical protein